MIAMIAIAWPAVASAEPPHRVQDELGTPLPAGGRVAPPSPRMMPSGTGLVPLQAQDRVHDLGLLRRADGTFGYRDPGHRFTALVRRDGSVLFADRWRRLDHRQHLSGRGLALPSEGARALNPFAGLRVTGPNEWALAMSGGDPSAAAKAGFLARTSAFRHKLAIGFARVQFKEGLRALPGQLLAIWSDRSRPAAERRRLIFRRWDDAAEPTSTPTEAPEATDQAAASIDIERARTGQAARDTIEAFCRRHLGPNTAHGFSPDELRRLNANRKSAATFDPYGSDTP
jgi:hypothetical protein